MGLRNAGSGDDAPAFVYQPSAKHLVSDLQAAQPARDSMWEGCAGATRAPTLTIKAVNITGAPTEVTGVYAGFIYKSSLPAEVLFGRGTAKLPLRELTGDRQPPCVLQAGETALWTANLRQLTDDLEERCLTITLHSRFLDSNSIDGDRLTRWGCLFIVMRNVIAAKSQQRLAVVIEDGRAGVHKATVKWQQPL